MKKLLITALMVLLLLAPFLFGGCSGKTEGKGFAIYLTRANVSVLQMEMLSHVDIADKPIIFGKDIISYTWNTHEIELTPEAYERLDEMQVPTSGKAFLVCVNKAPVYWGAFWPGYSSQSFDGITIWLKPSLVGENRIQITRGYPSGDFYKGEDPRSNPVIKNALEKAGKLK
jgi:hypothetical protein